jgi:hypothetical protein
MRADVCTELQVENQEKIAETYKKKKEKLKNKKKTKKN